MESWVNGYKTSSQIEHKPANRREDLPDIIYGTRPVPASRGVGVEHKMRGDPTDVLR
jgi:hypothetical protein